MERTKNKQAKLKVKKNDEVLVIAGNDKGKKGRVIEVFIEDRKVMVEGVNVVKKHLKANVNKNHPNGGIITKEMPVSISNVMVVSGGTATKIGRRLNDDGKLQRFSRKTGEFIK